MIFFYGYLLLVTLLSLIFKKKGIFLNYSGDIHQSFSNKKNVPLAGGFFILIPNIFFLNNFFINCFVVLIYLIGFFSDRKVLVSPKIRFLIQCLLILLFVLEIGFHSHMTRYLKLDPDQTKNRFYFSSKLVLHQ